MTRTPVDITRLQVGRDGVQRALLRAHIHLENAGGRSVYQHNVGNISVSRAAQQSGVDYWAPPWRDDASSPLHQLMLEGKEPSGFRAYPSLQAGLADYLRQLQTRFPSMLAARTPEQFVLAWKRSGYTPRLNVEATLRNFRPLFDRYLGEPKGALGGLLLAGACAYGAAKWAGWKPRWPWS